MQKYSPAGSVKKRPTLSRLDVLCAILSGVMLTASFPPGKLQWMAWFALVPLLKSLGNGPPSLNFRLGFIAGISHYLTLIYWIVEVLGRYGNLNTFVSFIPLLLLCLYLSLFPAFFAALTTLLRDSRFFLLFMSSSWVGLEYLRAKLLTGFPWCLLGYTQYDYPHLIQIADLGGVYGVSFLIVLINGLVYRCLFQSHEKRKRFLKWESLITVLLLGGTLLYGQYRLSYERTGKAHRQWVKALIVQGNIDQSIKWRPGYQSETMRIYQDLSRAVYDFNGNLIIWPETSVPFFFQDEVRFWPQLFSLTKKSGAVLVFGSPAYKKIDAKTKYYNRAFLMTPEGEPPKYYDKVHLVPFGEYIPLKKILFFLNRLVPAAGDFEAGDKIAPLNHRDLSLGILICFEAIFPELSRVHTRSGAHILVNLTNDAWFGMTSAPYQHLSMAVFRAVENRRPMIRAANTGFSAFIRPTGKIVALSALFSREVLRCSVPVGESSLTFYTLFGDVFAFSVMVISLIKILSFLWHRRINTR
jgi:apolipoprotein N-acyltransferase